ncbi:pimeloyl-ACP methyl ester carboxylesterase [Motilibacter peucedani]|uniref:Pimeloyl-ACP methyl ester carboxylesterase n=1 Tax=Motilibacter peucedani TaxID=598650 RepID=A0A420XQZ5_9ACTN|nr:alpha/beta fold hydrolase [Motilibacter peucedani]RKS75700.1 pimeloyl-ACP methyl ester carboxylesterase [Motilibacter peucedani]
MARTHLPEVPGVRHRWVEAAGLRVHVALAGPEVGEPVVLLHGWPQHWYAWRHVVAALPPDVRLVLPDLRGLGWSAAPRSGYGKEQLAYDLMATLDALDVRRAVLVGHDWGGYVAHLAALRWPDRVRALLEVAIVPPVSTLRIGPRDLRRFAYQPAMAAPLASQLALVTAPGVVERLLASAAHRSYSVEAEAAHSYAAVLREPARARASALYYRRFLLEDLPRVRAGRYDAPLEMPHRLVLGSHDPVIRRRFLPAGGREHVRVVHGSGHFVPEESPGELAAEVLRLL